MHLPLTQIHSKTLAAHRAAEAAHQQGQFWPMHDKIFENHRSMNKSAYERYARQIGLDMEKFSAALVSEKVRQRIRSDSQVAGRLGLTGTPAFIINGQLVSGAQPFAVFAQIIEAELAKLESK